VGESSACVLIGATEGEGEGAMVGKGLLLMAGAGTGISEGDGDGSFVGKLKGLRVFAMGAATGAVGLTTGAMTGAAPVG
jgi:hypothetical protein